MTFLLNADQQAALEKIERAERPGARFLLTGHAGTGKTSLMQQVARNAIAQGKRVVLSAPTHKAVAVLRRKLVEAGVTGVDCRTIHSLLSLKPKTHGDRQVFHRDRYAEPVMADIVVIDECSMIDEEMFKNIRRYLPVSFVLFVGDPAQLPPVGEVESLTFGISDAAHLGTVIRQAADNPVLAAAEIIRESQGRDADWSWCVKSALANGYGVFAPGDQAYKWMERAFTSEAFDKDPDSFRYLAWTNKRVHEVNRLARRWRYGHDIPTPFMQGERAMFRAPVIIDKAIVFATNEEASVLDLAETTVNHAIPAAVSVDSWTASIPVWRIRVRNDAGDERTVNLPSNDQLFRRALDRFRDEAADASIRWQQMHDFQSSFAQMQSIYALTTHCSQGSTFGTAFVDLPDIRGRQASNLLETQQLLYVAVSRASQRIVLVGG